MTTRISRRQVLVGVGVAAGLPALLPAAARAARPYTLKLGINLPLDHPTTANTIEAANSIKATTQGQVQVQVFPNSQLGDDTHMLSDLRSGAIQMQSIGDNILATLVPSAAIDNVGFAFSTVAAAWDAMDGHLGDIVRHDIVKAGLHPMHRIWDEGFRQISSETKPINTPEDLHGFKVRVPPSRISLSLFQSLKAAPTSINFAELYTALQTKIVDGQENPLSLVETANFYRVQKYCSLTNHMWNGHWILVNGPYWQSLPANYQTIIEEAFDAQAQKQRAASEQMNNSLEGKLKSQGMTFNTTDPTAFRDALIKSGYYSNWKASFGPTLWSALEACTGPLG